MRKTLFLRYRRQTVPNSSTKLTLPALQCKPFAVHIIVYKPPTSFQHIAVYLRVSLWLAVLLLSSLSLMLARESRASSSPLGEGGSGGQGGGGVAWGFRVEGGSMN